MTLRNQRKTQRFDFEKLEDRNLLSGTGGLIHVDLSGRDDFVPAITSGDPNGTPPVTPADLVDPNVGTSPFAGVVAVAPNGSGVCTGAAISPIHILTAGHCVDSDSNGISDISLVTSQVYFHHQAQTVVYTGLAASTAHPDYTGFANPVVNDDIAIWELNQPIPAGVPIYSINTDPWVDPELIFLAGYGTSGDAINGYTIGAGREVKRVGQNLASGFELDDEGSGSREVFLHDNDGPDLTTDWLGDGGTLGNEIEVSIGGGDSGGPSFIWDDSNTDGLMTSDELTLFGVNTFSGGGGFTGAPFYGSQAGGISVSAYADWITEFTTFGEIEVSADGVDISDGAIFDFGVTKLGTPFSRTFTVKNIDATPLTLVDPISVTGPFTVTATFGQLELAENETTTFTVRFNATSMGSFQSTLSFDNSDGDENPFNFIMNAAVTTPIGEADTLMATNRWQTVNLANSYADPVVVAGPASMNEADPATVRVRNVTSDSFQIRVQEWSYEDGKHIEERLSYVVMEAGVHRLSGGITILAGNHSGVSTTFGNVDFDLPFSDTPVVLAQAVTYNGGAPIVTRLNNIGTGSFQVAVQEEEAADQQHNPETISWIAFVPDQGTIGLSTFDSDITGSIVDEDVSVLDLEGPFAAPPVFLANQQSFRGSNTSTLRLADITNTTASVFVEEEQSKDLEIGHGNETVGFLAIEAGDILGRTIIGESGTVDDLDRGWQTVTLSQDYLDPVVLMSASTMNEAEPLTIRVRNVTKNSFETRVEEWNYQDRDHLPEVVSYMVFESGLHRLRDGTVIEARNSDVGVPVASIEFGADNGGETPLVFSQVITDNGPSALATRQSNITENGFQIYIQEEEVADGGHVVETVSWVSVKESSGDTGGIKYEAALHGTGVSHNVSTINLANDFGINPVVITSMQTTWGANTANVRQASVTPTHVDVFVQEEQSKDDEVRHVGESVALFALSAGIVDGFIIDLFADDASTPDPLISFFAAAPPTTNNSAVQQMLVNDSSASIDQDSAFEQLASGGLIHVDIDESSVIPMAGMTTLAAVSEFEIVTGQSADDNESDAAFEMEMDDVFG